jgi:hypothetical protein
MAASLEDSASNFLELEIPWISKRLSKQNITTVNNV